MARAGFLKSKVIFSALADIRAAPNFIFLLIPKIPFNGAALSDGSLYPRLAGAAEAATKIQDYLVLTFYIGLDKLRSLLCTKN